jgi:hypothetical protein
LSDSDNVTKQTSALTIAGQAEANARVELFNGTTSLGTTTADATTGAFSFDVTLAEGVHSITAKEIDLAGNVSLASAALTIRVDTSAAPPSGLDLDEADDTGSSDSDNITKQTTDLTIRGTAEAGSTVQLFDGTNSLGTATAIGGIFTRDVTLGAGARSITAIATDLAGNVSAASAALAITVDTVAPLTAVITGMSNDYGTLGDFTTDRNAVVLTGTADPNGQIELLIGGASIGFATVDSAGLWESPVISLAALSFGSSVNATIRAYDVAGNVSASNVSQVITKTSIAQTSFSLANLTSSVGFNVGNATNGAQMGGLSTGDVTGDGRKDLILSTLAAGTVTVLYGRTSWADVAGYNLANLGNEGYALVGTTTRLGEGGSGFIGDLNGDGFGELIAGDPGVNSNAGAAYIVWGSNAPLGTLTGNRYIKNVSTITPAEGFVFRGLANNDFLGNGTLGISSKPGVKSDFNGDGIADFFIASFGYDRPAYGLLPAVSDAGATIVVFGRADRAYGNLNTTTGQQEMTINDLTADKGFMIVGASNGSNIFSIASAGDVNGDGVTDLLIGSSGVNGAYVIYGKKTSEGQTWSGLIDDPTMPGRKILDLANLQSSNGFMILGSGANFGNRVEGLGDVNGDGFDDIIVSARNATVDGVGLVGRTFVIFGSATGQGTISAGRQILSADTMTSSQGFIIEGETTDPVGGRFGDAVGPAGDVNADGLADIIVSAPVQDNGASSNNGRAYVIYGKNSGEGWGQAVGTQSILSLNNFGPADGFSFSGRQANDNLGLAFSDGSVTSPGDLNNDGVDDLFMHARSTDSFGRGDNGDAFFIYGVRGQGGLSLTGSALANVLNGGGMADTINGSGGADQLRGFAGNDMLIIGDASFVRVDGGAGTDTLRMAGTSGFTLNLSTLAAGAIKDIEVIDLVAGSLNNILTVTQQTLMNLSTTTNRLMVLGGSGDTVNANGFTATGSATDNGITYTTYTNGAATLWVQSGVNVVGATPLPGGFVLMGVDGHDMLIVDDANFLGVDGGAGTDILPMAGTSGFGLDLSTLTPGAINDIEPIDLVAGELNNMLTITQQTLLDFSTTSDHLTFTQSGSGDTQIGFGADTSMMVEGYLPAKLTDFLTSTPSSLIVL